jgi:hypothetical protein
MSNSLEFLGKAATPLRAAGCNRAVAQSSQWVLILRSRNGGARTKFCVNRFFSEARADQTPNRRPGKSTIPSLSKIDLQASGFVLKQRAQAVGR